MKLAISINAANATRETFEALHAASVDAVELSNGQKSAADLIDFPALKAYADEFGITLWSFHLAFAPFSDIDISQPEIADSTVAYSCEMIDKAAAVGIRTFVIHPSGEPIREEDRPMRLACAKTSLARLAAYAAQYGAVIAVEDLPRTCLGRDSSDILELISAHPALRVCFDTNHLLREPIVDFIRACGDRIVTLHVSDYDFINERHWLPGEGQIPWGEVYDALCAVGYDGYFLYEVSLNESDWTIERPRRLTFADMRRTFDEISSGRAPTGVGVGKRDLPMKRPKS